MKITVATFDLDHTLVRRVSDHLITLKMKAINQALEDVLGIREIHYMRHLGPELYGMTDRSIIRAVLIKLGMDKEKVNERLDRLFEVMIEQFTRSTTENVSPEYMALDGVGTLLEFLRKSRIKCGLATGNYSVFAKWKLRSAGLEEYFDFGGYGEDSEDRAEILNIALARAGNRSHLAACHFGDSPADMRAARANGILAAAVTIDAGGKFSGSELEDAGAQLVINSYKDIERIADFLGA